MRARLVVFPIKGKNWCFTRSINDSLASTTFGSGHSQTPSTLRELWRNISSNPKPFNANAELLIDFVSLKMNNAWIGLEKAPQGTLKNKIHLLGLRLLSRVKPSEIFLNFFFFWQRVYIFFFLTCYSMQVQSSNFCSFCIISLFCNHALFTLFLQSCSLNARLVRRRLRHIATRGNIIHKKYFYGSVALLPLSTVFTVLPLPNIPFFWILFRTYSHWRALQGSEKLLQLVSDSSSTLNSSTGNENETKHDGSKYGIHNSVGSPWVLQPSKELEELLHRVDGRGGLSKCAISDICKIFDLNSNDVLKYRDSM
ncbi:uncharacterized protein LOC112033546 [Quercus suber]|uniref:uncharacterized protein LOC112033546 n=1 Tax=Quercus suber TaxID=58331 RepID=UPI0032DE9244